MSGRIHIRVEGVVQGVGYRPFVRGLAGVYGIAGFVGNDREGVFIEAQGDASSLRAFLDELERTAPPLATVERVTVTASGPAIDAAEGFHIVATRRDGTRRALVPPDTAPCATCLAELTDPSDRRHRYAFTHCPGCGPRYTIVTDLPYDRPDTTMAVFPMCADCAREYHDPHDRRCHAQSVCCPACGPALTLLDADGKPREGDPIETAARWLEQGRIVAIKGAGGYHLAVLAGNERAVAELRRRKHREAKPFALTVADASAARRLVVLDAAAERVLTGARRPIVLLPRRSGAPVAAAVAPGSRELGVMLPATPLHHLLALRLGQPYVLTGGNRADEPIAHRDEDALERLAGIADGFLTHDREIRVRTEDSVVRVFRGREMPVRRSRGYVPDPLRLRLTFPRHVLAVGTDLKNTFCLGKDARAFLSQHIGDLADRRTLRSFTEAVDHLTRLLGVRPSVVAHDPHPEYLSTKYAMELEDVTLVGVQHHHAHIVSCMAENGEAGPVIGVALDGLGFGPDGTMWGGEILLAHLTDFRRVGHLEAVPMPGGAAAVGEPWRMAAAYLTLLFGETPPSLGVVRRHQERWETVTRLAGPPTSSAGRLFDAVAAILDVRDTVSYEGQAAIELEQMAARDERGAYPVTVSSGEPVVIASGDLVRCVVRDVATGVGRGRIAARFHNGLARGLVTAVRLVRERTGVGVAALSGGMFQNALLLEKTVCGLEEAGIRVLLHGKVPCDDGGISLGQAAVAAARMGEAGR